MHRSRARRSGLRLCCPGCFIRRSRAPASGPTARSYGRRHFLFTSLVTTGLQELVEDSPDSWSVAQIFTPAVLDTPAITAVSMSADGRRVILTANTTAQPSQQVLTWLDRQTIDDGFGSVAPIVGAPCAEFAFLTEDCARLYVSGLDSIFYAQPL